HGRAALLVPDQCRSVNPTRVSHGLGEAERHAERFFLQVAVLEAATELPLLVASLALVTGTHGRVVVRGVADHHPAGAALDQETFDLVKNPHLDREVFLDGWL